MAVIHSTLYSSNTSSLKIVLLIVVCIIWCNM